MAKTSRKPPGVVAPDHAHRREIDRDAMIAAVAERVRHDRVGGVALGARLDREVDARQHDSLARPRVEDRVVGPAVVVTGGEHDGYERDRTHHRCPS